MQNMSSSRRPSTLPCNFAAPLRATQGHCAREHCVSTPPARQLSRRCCYFRRREQHSLGYVAHRCWPVQFSPGRPSPVPIYVVVATVTPSTRSTRGDFAPQTQMCSEPRAQRVARHPLAAQMRHARSLPPPASACQTVVVLRAFPKRSGPVRHG
ncbi:hypothetical protein C7974DRAFT_377711 [Boeremia exigua]|uniref:uncharacterized protein n=1 Tax=Boeremia exigua TaxID=749465 RepID=UPI001E8CC749|nr:uncharacterized protein C7974DRAFT_377711 [Boeremia exigua]KAH6622095.1 hypothetical protein C7974DRAFT_377711 [Boeremia exigua]